jgi:hypothetical protein
LVQKTGRLALRVLASRCTLNSSLGWTRSSKCRAMLAGIEKAKIAFSGGSMSNPTLTSLGRPRWSKVEKSPSELHRCILSRRAGSHYTKPSTRKDYQNALDLPLRRWIILEGKPIHKSDNTAEINKSVESMHDFTCRAAPGRSLGSECRLMPRTARVMEAQCSHCIILPYQGAKAANTSIAGRLGTPCYQLPRASRTRRTAPCHG